MRQFILLFIITFFFTVSSLFASENKEYTEAERFLSAMIQYESYSGKEKDVSQYILQYAQENNLYTQVLTDVDTLFNFTASLYPLSDKRPNIILSCHTDIVHVGQEDKWTHPPLSGYIDSLYIWGRGAIDCKGLIAMQLVALIESADSLRSINFPYNITYLGLASEETNGEGARYVTEHLLDTLNAITVFGEGGSGIYNVIPSNPCKPVFGISTSEKSTLWLKITAENKNAGHGAVPPGLYANKRLIKGLINLLDDRRPARFSPETKAMFKFLGREEGGTQGFVLKHINWVIFWPFVKRYFEPGEIFHAFTYNTFVITQITNPEGDINQISSEASAWLDCRILPGASAKRFNRRIDGILGPKFDVEVIHEGPEAEPSPLNNFYYTFKNSLLMSYPESGIAPIMFPASSDNNYFRRKGIPTYGIIPAILSEEEIESVHNINEKIKRVSLQKGIEVYRNFFFLVSKNQKLANK